MATKRLNPFERYLSLWVGLWMLAGVALGVLAPSAMAGLRQLEFGDGSQINIPIAILIWLMITPMMMTVDFGAVRNVDRRPRGLFVTLFVNWLVKPFSLALIAWVFFRLLFSPWISPADADQYIAGCIILAAAPCTAMVFVWRYFFSDGDPAYTLVQVSVNDLLMLVLFAPIVRYLVSGADVDQALVTFAADADWARAQGATIERINLAQDPTAFAANATVRTLLERSGRAALPIVLVDGDVAMAGRYPQRAEFARWAGLKVTTPLPMATTSCCSGPDCC